MIDGEEQELPDGTPFMHAGEEIEPKSRTFIPASLSDNAYYRDTDYRGRLQTLPEPLRSQLLYGDFQIGFQDQRFPSHPDRMGLRSDAPQNRGSISTGSVCSTHLV